MSRERAELSKKNPYHIPRYRYYELKYFCRQYDDWKKALTLIDGWQTSPNDISGIIKGCPPESPTERIALSRVFYSSCICIAALGLVLGIAIGFNLSEGQRCVGDLVIAPGDEDADHYMFLDLAKSPETLAGKERVMLNIKMIRTRK